MLFFFFSNVRSKSTQTVDKPQLNSLTNDLTFSLQRWTGDFTDVTGLPCAPFISFWSSHYYYWTNWFHGASLQQHLRSHRAAVTLCPKSSSWWQPARFSPGQPNTEVPFGEKMIYYYILLHHIKSYYTLYYYWLISNQWRTKLSA